MHKLRRVDPADREKLIEAVKEENNRNSNAKNLAELIDYLYENGGYFMLGGDVEQEWQAPGHILASAIKRVDVARDRKSVV